MKYRFFILGLNAHLLVSACSPSILDGESKPLLPPKDVSALIIGFNAPPHSLTLDRIDQLAQMGLKSWRVVEPYDEGSTDEVHLKSLLNHVLANRGEALVTLLNSNPGVEFRVSSDIWSAFLAKENGDVGRARRALIAGGIRTENINILTWIREQAKALHQFLPLGATVEFWNADIFYWGTDWVSSENLFPEWVTLFNRLGDINAHPNAFDHLQEELKIIFAGRSQLVMGGFLYGESDGIHKIGPLDQICELGVNVLTSGSAFSKVLTQVPVSVKRVYLQWLVNPQWGWWALPLERQSILWAPLSAKEFLKSQNREADPYGLISELGWQPVYDFISFFSR